MGCIYHVTSSRKKRILSEELAKALSGCESNVQGEGLASSESGRLVFVIIGVKGKPCFP